MIPSELQHVLSTNPAIMGGAICFTGTRIPVKVVLDNLHDGIPVSDLLDSYPSLNRQHIQAILDWAYRQASQSFGFASASA